MQSCVPSEMRFSNQRSGPFPACPPGPRPASVRAPGTGSPYLLLETCGLGFITLDGLLILSPFPQARLLHRCLLPALRGCEEGGGLIQQMPSRRVPGELGGPAGPVPWVWELTPKADRSCCLRKAQVWTPQGMISAPQ